jgi:hypothetical protein
MTGLQKGIVAGLIGLFFAGLLAFAIHARMEQPPARIGASIGQAQSAAAIDAKIPAGPVGDGERYGLAVVRNEAGALDKLDALAKSEQLSFKSNAVNLNDQQKVELARQTFTPLHVAFEVIVMAATNHSAVAVNAISKSLTMPDLSGSALHALGLLAALGDEKALEFLVTPEKHGVPLSGAVSSLKPAAEKGNQKAIEFIAAVTRNPKAHALWFLVADDLRSPAAAGNATAIEALIPLLTDKDPNVRKAATMDLQQAAANNIPKAVSALKAAGISSP